MDLGLDGVPGLVRPPWPPLRHVHDGWNALTDQERGVVRDRLERVLADTRLPESVPRDALLRFFSFLAQVETIAIEVPMRFLPHAQERLRPGLRRQLVDEVFHSVLFSRIAHDLARPAAEPPAPLESAQRLLRKIREQEDLAITATLLNLAAEGWIETLFRHARTWGIADAAFQAVLEDEARHVHEASDYAEDLDLQRAADTLAELEESLIEVGSEPSVSLAMIQIAGVERYHELVKDLHRSHVRHLKTVDLEPSAKWVEATTALEESVGELVHHPEPPVPVEDTVWRQAARRVWASPLDPTMHGEFTVRVGHFPSRLTTPLFIAAVGRAWADHPELNVVLAQGKRWRLPDVNVGVRVMVDDNELATVVVPGADKRSLADITYMLQDGLKQLQAMKRHRPSVDGEEQKQVELDPSYLQWGPPSPLSFSVSVSNVGRFGLEAGAGCFTGHYSPSTDLTIGMRQKMPVWRGIGYWPTPQVRVGALQDHRLFDGNHAGIAMRAVKSRLTPRAFRGLRRAPDTLPQDKPETDYGEAWISRLPPGLQALPAVSFVKYSPFVIGGATALGAGLGLGGYFLIRALAGEGSKSEVAPPSPGGQTGPWQGPSTTGGQFQAPDHSLGGTCLGMERDGTRCQSPSVPGHHHCARHRR